MDGSFYCHIPSSIVAKLYIMQKKYVHNAYMHQHVTKLFNLHTQYPRFCCRVLRCDLQESVPVRFRLLKFYDIPQAEKGHKFAAWMYIFVFNADTFTGEESFNEVYNPDIVRVVRQFVIRRLYASPYWKDCLYAEDLGINAEPGPLQAISPDLPAEEIEKRLIPFSDSALSTF